jgi:hypothetical protein
MAEGETESVSSGEPAGAGDGRPSAEEVRSWAGHRLDEVEGANVGKVEGAYLDPDSGQPEWILARMGRFGHYCLVPVRDAVGGVGRVWVPYTRDQIRRAPKIEPKTAITKQRETELLGYYGIGGEAGRMAEIAKRDEDAVTASPAG